MAEDNQFDLMENTVGKFGLWQLWISAIIIFSKFPSAFFQGSVVYLLPHTKFKCIDPDVSDEQDKVCESKCDKYEFDRDVFKETVITEFELVCDKKYLGALTHTIFMIGNGFGNVLAGIFADSYGRKKIYYSYILLHFVAIIGTVVSPNFPIFLICRFISGFGIGGLSLGFVIMLEIVGGRFREIVSCLYLLTFPIGLMSLAALAYFVRYWRRLYSVLGIVSLIIVITTIFIPESPRYLVAHNKIDKGVAILERGAKQNGLPVEKIRENVEKATKSASATTIKTRGGLHTIVGHKSLRFRLFICAYIFFSSGVTFFGILQYIGRLDDNLFLSNFFGAMTGIPGLFVCMILTRYCPRKLILILSSLTITIGMLFVMYYGKSIISVLSASISLFGLSILVPTMTIFIGEYFPTIVRSTAVGVSFSLSNFGSALSSFPPHLADYVFWGPPLLFAILSSIGIILLIFVPETKGKPLPTTLEDVEK